MGTLVRDVNPEFTSMAPISTQHHKAFILVFCVWNSSDSKKPDSSYPECICVFDQSCRISHVSRLLPPLFFPGWMLPHPLRPQSPTEGHPHHPPCGHPSHPACSLTPCTTFPPLMMPSSPCSDSYPSHGDAYLPQNHLSLLF